MNRWALVAGVVCIFATFLCAAEHNLIPEATLDGDAWVWGFVDLEGNVVVKPRYEECYPYREGLARVRRAGKYGFIDVAGLEVIPPIYRVCNDFSEGLAAAKLKDDGGRFISPGDYGYIDKEGKTAIAGPFMKAEDFSEGLAYVQWESAAGYINKKGEAVIIGDMIGRRFRCGRAAVIGSYNGHFKDGIRLSGYVGYIDRSGQYVIPQGKYLGGGDFYQGHAVVGICTSSIPSYAARKFIIIDTNGVVVQDWSHDSASQILGNHPSGFVKTIPGINRIKVSVPPKHEALWGMLSKWARENYTVLTIPASFAKAPKEGRGRPLRPEPFDRIETPWLYCDINGRRSDYRQRVICRDMLREFEIVSDAEFFSRGGNEWLSGYDADMLSVFSNIITQMSQGNTMGAELGQYVNLTTDGTQDISVSPTSSKGDLRRNNGRQGQRLPTPPQETLNVDLSAVVIPYVEFINADIRDVLRYLTSAYRDFRPAGRQAMSLTFDLAVDRPDAIPQITFLGEGISLSAILENIKKQASLDYSIQADRIILKSCE